jgi:hypothetical protein
VLVMDTIRALTRGPLNGWPVLFAQLHPARECFTAVLKPSQGPPRLIGQMEYYPGQRAAQISYLLPGNAGGLPDMPGLLEGLAWQAGHWGAQLLLADVDERSPFFEALRRAGFSVYAWQRVWRLAAPCHPAHAELWHTAAGVDVLAAYGLYQGLVPPMVQRAESFPRLRSEHLAYRQDGEMLAYVEVIEGSQGVFLQPYIHPQVNRVRDLLDGLAGLPRWQGRPVYLAVRSYQAWLEPALEEMQSASALRQALLVKYLTAAERVTSPVREAQTAEHPAAPVYNITK